MELTDSKRPAHLWGAVITMNKRTEDEMLAEIDTADGGGARDPIATFEAPAGRRERGRCGVAGRGGPRLAEARSGAVDLVDAEEHYAKPRASLTT